MSAATVQRTGKAAKDRGSKTQSNQSQNSKSVDKIKMPDGLSSKLQPNAEQLRIAQIVGDQMDDPDLNEKVEQVKEITGKTYDDVIVALHDCDLDTNRATNLLLEGGNQTTGEWQVSGKKKRNRQPPPQKANGVPAANTATQNNQTNNKENRNRAERSRDRDPKEREVMRNRGPPRLNRLNNRGAWRGRGRGGSRSRTFQNRGLSSGGFPQSIDTWTNSTAEQTDAAAANDSAMPVGNWSDFTAGEDWSEEDWTGSLTETKVFTPSANAHSLVNNIDESPTHISQSLDLASLLHKTASTEPSINQNSLSSSVMSQPQQHSTNVSPPTVSSSVTQAPADSQTQFNLSQYAKQAAESIKAAVGIGSSLNTSSSLQQGSSSTTSPFTSAYSSSSVSGGTSHPTASPSPVLVPMESQQMSASQAPGLSTTNASQQKPRQSSQQPPQALPQRGRNQQRPKVPKPSKIPQSAVEMPDDAVTALDVQFGALEFGTDSSPFDLASSVETTAAFQEVETSTSSSVTNHIIPQPASGSQSTVVSSASTTLSTTLVPSSTISKESSFSFGSHTSASATNQAPPKELEQAAPMSHSQKVSGTETSLLSASQNDRSSVGSVTGYASQRASQPSTFDAYTSQTSSTYQPSVNSFTTPQNYSSTTTTATTPSGSSLHSATVAQSKLTSSLSHSMKESVLDSQRNSAQHSYEPSHVAVTNTSSGLTATATSSSVSTSSLSSGSISVSSTLGLASSSTVSSTTVSKSSVSATGKAMPSIPPGVPPVLGHQYIMSQTGMPFYGLQQPVYNYEDLQMLQSRLPPLGYYDVQFQAPTSLTGRDPSLGSVAYTGTDGKFSRAEDATSVATTLSQGQGTTQTHGQPFLNPAAPLPPGYGYYFPGSMMPGSIHHYGPPIFPIPPATNTNGATTSTQFQKPVAYLSHSYPSASAYDTMSQTQDFKGGYGPTAQVQGKGVSGSSTASGAGADLTGPMYSKTHAPLAKANWNQRQISNNWSYMDGNATGLVNINSVGNQRKDDSKLLSSIIPPALYHCTNAYTNSSFEKPGFHTGTPPPFNLAGTQTAGAIGASSGPYAAAATSFIPLLHGQHHSTMLHHHLQQDTPQPGSGSAGGPQRSGPQGLSQQKGPSGNKQSMAYWNNN